MSNPAMPAVITDQAQWEKIAHPLEKTRVLSIDLEGNGYFRYPEHICLIQLATFALTGAEIVNRSTTAISRPAIEY